MTEKRPAPHSGLDLPLELIARVLHGRLAGMPTRAVRRPAVDSRAVEPGDLFFALSGGARDGHEFLTAALERGASGVVVQAGRPLPVSAVRAAGVIVVPDPLLALGALAAWHRDRFRGPVVGITGSLGKTTTRDLVAGVLGARWHTLCSPGNWNTEIGVPLTLLARGPEHGAAVVEMAMRGPGQIRYLAEIARPKVAVITTIGWSHHELLGSRDAIAAAKAELLDYLPENGCAVLPAVDDYAGFLRSRVPVGAATLAFGGSSPGIHSSSPGIHSSSPGIHSWGSIEGEVVGVVGPERRDLPGAGWRTCFRVWEVDGGRGVSGEERETSMEGAPDTPHPTPHTPHPSRHGTLPLLGEHNLRNGLAAIAVGRALGLEWPEILAGLAGAEITGMRSRIGPLQGGGLLVDDAYNASSPEAVLGALEVLHLLPGRRKLAVLADMLELGDASEQAHRTVGAGVAARAPAALVTIGERARGIAEGASAAGFPADRIRVCATREAGLAAVEALRRPGDVVLVKGSRGMALEALVAALRGEESAE